MYNEEDPPEYGDPQYDDDAELTLENDEDDYFAFGQTRTIPPKANRNDLTLNNPLIIDEVEAVFKMSLRQQTSFRATATQRKVAEALRNIPRYSPLHPSLFHRRFAISLGEAHASPQFAKLLTDCEAPSTETWEVAKAFIYGWLREIIPYQPRSDLPSCARHVGSLFYELQNMVIALNAEDPTEVDKLGPDYSYETNSGMFQVTYNSPVLGAVICIGGYAYLGKWTLLLDRTMAIMWKDCAGGRFQALVSEKYGDNGSGAKAEHLRQLLRAGDQIIRMHGSQGYEAIKMVEAISSDHINQIGSQQTPLFPRFTRFQGHIDAAMEGLAIRMPEALTLREHLRSSQDIGVSITAYGCYRLWGHPFVDYLEGLRKLHHNTTCPKDIDKAYAEVLASDLAFKILVNQYRKKHIWFSGPVEAGHPLRQ